MSAIDSTTYKATSEIRHAFSTGVLDKAICFHLICSSNLLKDYATLLPTVPERLIGCIVHKNIIDPPIPSAERLGQLFELVPLLDVRLLSRLLEEGLTDRLLKVLTLTTRDNYDELVARILRKIG